MQIQPIIHQNYYKNNKKCSLNFKSGKEEIVSTKVMTMMKKSIKDIFCYSELNDVNKYAVPNVHKRLNSYPLAPALNIIKVPSQQLAELLGNLSKDYKLSLLEGLCVVITDKNAEPDKCDYIYETTVCLIPNPDANPSLYELLFK